MTNTLLKIQKIKNRSWFISIVLLFLLCVYLFFYFYQSEKERIKSEIVGHQKIHAKQAARSFYELIDKWKNALFHLSKNRNIVQMNEEGKAELESLLGIMKDEIAGISRTDEMGKIIFTTPYDKKSVGADISKQKHIVKILNDNKPVISDVFMTVQGFQAIAIHYPIIVKGEYKGSVALLLNFEKIAQEILKDIYDAVSTRAWMISADGIEMYCMYKEHIGESVFEVTNSSEVKKLAQLMMKGGEGQEFFRIKGQDDKQQKNAIVYYLPIKVNDTFWSLAITSTQEELREPIFNFSLKLFLVFGIVFIGGVLLSNYVLKARAIFKETEARKKAEEDLKLSEERHRLISEVASDYIFATSLGSDGNLCHDWVSGAFSSMTEYSFEEYKEKGGWNSFVFEDDRHLDEAALNELRNNKHAVLELRTVSKSGKILWVRVFAHPVWDEKENKLVGIYGAVQNITERKNAEITLKENEEKFRAIYNSVNDAMFIHDLNNGDIIDVNLTMQKMFGVTYEEALSYSVGELSAGLEPYSQKEAMAWIFKTIEIGPQTFEWLAKTKSGSLFWVEVSMSVVKLTGQERLLVSARNITERKKFEEQIKTLYLAMDQSPASVVITNAEGIIEYVNAGFCTISGFTRSELIGIHLRILNAQKEMDIDRNQLWNTLKDGKEWRSEHKNKRKDGTPYWESTLISPVINNEGKMIHFLAVQEDITERKETEKKLMDAIVKEEEMSRLKSNFLSNMSHELRTPLVGMLGLSELLYDEVEGENKEFVEMINKSSNRLLGTLNTLLNYSKIDSEEVKLNITKVSLLDLVREEVKLFTPFANKNGLYIKEDFKCDNVNIDTDEIILKEIMDNLLNNAIRFTTYGGITVSVEKNIVDFCISISDTGIGIPEDKVDLIFEEFRQVSEGKGRNFEGTGLGLTIVKKYVDAMKGTIQVLSKIGEGTTFKICIPSNDYFEQSVTENPNQVKLTTEEVRKTVKSNVLLVEDDEISTFAVTRMLNDVCVVTSVSNAEDAVYATNENKFDVVLMDINLRRGKSGVEAAQEIRQNPVYSKTPIVALTAYAMSSDKVEFLEAGFTHYLSKPFSREQIINLIQEIHKEINLG
ncbi:MAG: NarL family signal transduction histidine kinase [Ignavibacteria bacterium]|nr:MAG: NarL family signal transduction histidine kinase [Ignavibacteria bacterium]KAF0160995.1 MAG: NarL family signal transduction histidine kinase [Ignavibacteria bacterium]